MRQRRLFGWFIASVMCSFLSSALAAKTPVGIWKIIDDQTAKKRALIQLTVSDGVLNGTIIKIFPQPGDTGICSKCPGEFKGKPIEGLQIVWGLQAEGNGVWSNGKILDPKAGKIYNVKMTIEDNQLKVRGYIGWATLGRTQTWVR
ncbi:MAG: DUF2147 domain-containing protein [Legionella sp.]|nr:DUF2147 domain-containing protein [Legionella sp.]